MNLNNKLKCGNQLPAPANSVKQVRCFILKFMLNLYFLV